MSKLLRTTCVLLRSTGRPATGWRLGLLVLGLGVAVRTGHAAPPAWWQARGAVSANAAPAPYAVVNQGQLKHFTAEAVAELNADLPGGAGTTLNNLVSGWQQDYATHAYATDPNNSSRPYKPADFDAVTVGQLKYVASLIYGCLRDAGYPGLYPTWLTTNASTDSALANLGQLKTVFNFDVGSGLDPDGSGLSTAWEEEYFGKLGVDPNAQSDGDGLTNLQKYQQGIVPGKKDNPVLQLTVVVVAQ